MKLCYINFQEGFRQDNRKMNKRILVMVIIAGVGVIAQMIISSTYPASEISFTLGIALAVFGVIIAIQIILYSKVKKEIQ